MYDRENNGITRKHFWFRRRNHKRSSAEVQFALPASVARKQYYAIVRLFPIK